MYIRLGQHVYEKSEKLSRISYSQMTSFIRIIGGRPVVSGILNQSQTLQRLIVGAGCFGTAKQRKQSGLTHLMMIIKITVIKVEVIIIFLSFDHRHTPARP